MFLCANKINDAGAQALAMLKDSTTLGTLSLRCNEIGHAGVQALAMLKGSNTSSSRADDSCRARQNGFAPCRIFKNRFWSRC